MKDGRNQRILNIGIDIGSTTTKTAVLDAQTGEVLFSAMKDTTQIRLEVSEILSTELASSF